MRITFYGAAQEVTGSMHLIEVNGQRCCSIAACTRAGAPRAYERNLTSPSIQRPSTRWCSATPTSTTPATSPTWSSGLRGHIWCTPATRDLSAYMLPDSGNIQEQDVEYLNKRSAAAGEAACAAALYPRPTPGACSQFIGIGLHRHVHGGRRR